MLDCDSLSSCVFWQTPSSNEEGRKYCERYDVHQYPHIALLDPRTGRLLWRRDKFMGADAMTEKVSDFCSRYSLEVRLMFDV